MDVDVVLDGDGDGDGDGSLEMLSEPSWFLCLRLIHPSHVAVAVKDHVYVYAHANGDVISHSATWRDARGDRGAFQGKSAEREGFEPSVRLPVHMISNHAPSATRSSLRVVAGGS